MKSSSSFHMQYAFSFPEESYFGKTFPSTYQGAGLAVNTFSNSAEIGTPAAIYILQGASLARLAPSLTLGYEWNFGASFGWKPYREYTNPNNTVVGSRINAYICFGLLLDWHISESWNAMFGLEAAHFSNGNTKYPNSGVNTLSARLGVSYSFETIPGRKTASVLNNIYNYGSDGTRRRWTLDATLYGAGRAKAIIWEENPYIVSGKFGILGINVNPLFRVNKFLRAGISADIQYDESANIDRHIAGHHVDSNGEDLRFFRPPLKEQLGAGLSLRAEFVMPVFSVNIGFGHNVIYKGDDLKGFYQIVALKTNVTRHLFIHIGYKLSRFQDPNNLMIGLGWKFGDDRW